MYRARARWMAFFVLTGFLLCSCGKEEQKSEVLLYQVKENDTKKEQFKTTKVEKGVYKEVVSTSGKLYYLDENEVSINEDRAYLDKIYVKHKQKVKKGDVLALYHIKTSKASLEKRKLMVEQARSQFDSSIRSKQSEVLAQEKSIKTLTSAAEKKLARIELKKLRQEYNQLLKSEKDIKSQEKEYAELLRKRKGAKLVSKFSGTVIDPVSSSEFGGESASGEKLMTIRNESDFLIQADDDAEGLRYNMKVEIGLGATKDDIEHKVTGRVISTDNLSSSSGNEEEGGNTGGQMITLSKSDMKKYNFKKFNIYITGVTLSIPDALMVDAEAVYEELEGETTKQFVMLVENGNLHKRYIVSNYKQDTKYLVNQGVEEGQTLAILKQ
ncbi:MAG: efflux RND transporter periplasmic adaptor subunit [Lachnospiraceae bacterium]|nr:efflux RND transporter periplasmic adaptor subunit [Lachnospiraceae bacterium]